MIGDDAEDVGPHGTVQDVDGDLGLDQPRLLLAGAHHVVVQRKDPWNDACFLAATHVWMCIEDGTHEGCTTTRHAPNPDHRDVLLVEDKVAVRQNGLCLHKVAAFLQHRLEEIDEEEERDGDEEQFDGAHATEPAAKSHHSH